MKHIILISSCFKIGKRIAYDILDENKVDSIIEEIQSNFESSFPLSAQVVETDSNSWESVVKLDPFFKGIMNFENLDDFIKHIKMDRKLSVFDFVGYISSTCKCTHLKLQKLLYLVYADYLVTYDNKLFDDSILAYKYGPVVLTVYDKYKTKNKYDLSFEEESENKIIGSANLKMPYKSRILSSENGVEKLFSIDKTLRTYKDLSANELVNITHRKNSPWSNTKQSQIITDTTIKEYHQNEII